MAKIVVNSPDKKANVYRGLAKREQRILKTQFVLIVRRKLKRWGLILRENERDLLETNCSQKDKNTQHRGIGIPVSKIPSAPTTHFENHQMIVREAKPLLLIGMDM